MDGVHQMSVASTISLRTRIWGNYRDNTASGKLNQAADLSLPETPNPGACAIFKMREHWKHFR
jgi:hypothetical protein